MINRLAEIVLEIVINSEQITPSAAILEKIKSTFNLPGTPFTKGAFNVIRLHKNEPLKFAQISFNDARTRNNLLSQQFKYSAVLRKSITIKFGENLNREEAWGTCFDLKSTTSSQSEQNPDTIEQVESVPTNENQEEQKTSFSTNFLPLNSSTSPFGTSLGGRRLSFYSQNIEETYLVQVLVG